MTKHPKTLHHVASGIAAAYLVAVAFVVFWPTPVDRPAAGTLDQALAWLHDHGLPQFVDYAVVEFTANIAMFLPLGILASVWSRRAWAGTLIGFTVSCLIELAQSLLLTARFATVSDVLANTLGALTGASIYFFWHRSHSRGITSLQTESQKALKGL